MDLPLSSIWLEGHLEDGFLSGDHSTIRRRGMRKIKTGYFSLFALAFCVLCWGCSYKTLLMEGSPFKERAQTQTIGKVTVTTSVLNSHEGKKHFGINLARKGIQPVWIKIDNRSDEHYFFFPISLDPDYYAASEVYYMNRYSMARWKNSNLEEHIEKYDIGTYVAAQKVTSGFVFTNMDQGNKFVSIQIVAKGREKRFSFLIAVDDIKADYHKVDFKNLYPRNEIKNTQNEASFRKALEALPCCTHNKKGTKMGDPLNFVLVGSAQEVFPPLVMRGWDETELIYKGSTWLTVKSFLRGIEYRYSPISPLYVFGRSQDLALQKARGTINERNHLRLWLTPIRYKGKEVWVGQISRDIGVRFTTKTWNLTTHKIDPDLDEARGYLMQDLLASQGVKKLGLVKGEHFNRFTRKFPGYNLTGDPYWTDGFLFVFEFSKRPTSLTQLDFFPWERKYPEAPLKKVGQAKY